MPELSEDEWLGQSSVVIRRQGLMCKPAGTSEFFIEWIEERIDKTEVATIDQARSRVPKHGADGFRVCNRSGYSQNRSLARTI